MNVNNLSVPVPDQSTAAQQEKDDLHMNAWLLTHLALPPLLCLLHGVALLCALC